MPFIMNRITNQHLQVNAFNKTNRFNDKRNSEAVQNIKL